MLFERRYEMHDIPIFIKTKTVTIFTYRGFEWYISFTSFYKILFTLLVKSFFTVLLKNLKDMNGWVLEKMSIYLSKTIK